MKLLTSVVVLGIIIISSGAWMPAYGTPVGPPSGPSPFGGPFTGTSSGKFVGPPSGPPSHKGDFLSHGNLPPELIEVVKLSDDQMKQMRHNEVNFRDRTRKSRSVLMGLEDEKNTMVLSGKIDRTKLEKLDEDIGKVSSEIMEEERKMKRDFVLMLTTEQIERMGDFLIRREIRRRP